MSAIVSRNIGAANGLVSPRYSICTLVTDWNLYQQMLDSFREAGFASDIAEYLHIDNRGANTTDAYNGINRFLTIAQGRYVILCHQDILLEYDRIEQLEKCISQLNDLDPNWALLGNAGGVHLGKIAVRITDPGRANDKTAGLPAKVQALDENFILIRRDANLGTSRDLSGFHLYGLDLCLLSAIRGYSAYVIDFHLRHLSAGNFDEVFHASKNLLIEKYRKIFPWKYYQTSFIFLFLSGNAVLNRILNHRYILALIAKYFAHKRRFQPNHDWQGHS
jgi:hypothetical protein